MKKNLCLLLAIVVLIAGTFAACSNSSDEEDTTNNTTSTTDNVESANNTYGLEEVEVTDENGETVTDENGNVQTELKAVVYVTDENGNTIAKLVDDDGEVVTDENGNDVTIKTDYSISENTDDDDDDDNGTVATTYTTKATTSTTATTAKNENTTKSELTTLSASKDSVPLTSDTGDIVSFSSDDQQIIKSMLEVPYLYNASYENADGVPINIASHAALWMIGRENYSISKIASGTVVLDLFKFFGQTVVNYKSLCNTDSDNDNITYKSSSDYFRINSYEESTHTVTITQIQDLGNNNYYKVTAKVSGAGSISKVVAVVQKNKLDSSLGFSIKALKWS